MCGPPVDWEVCESVSGLSPWRGGWVTEVTDRDCGPRCVEKPCWPFTKSLWRGRLRQAAQRPCCSGLQNKRNMVVILIRDNLHQICPVWFLQHTWKANRWLRLCSYQACLPWFTWSLESFSLVYLCMKRMTVMLGSRWFPSTTSCALNGNKHQTRKYAKKSVMLNWKFTKKSPLRQRIG